MNNYFLERSKVAIDEVFFDEKIQNKMNQFLLEYQFKNDLLQYKLPVANKILLFGATGCGKTHTAKAIATHFNLKLVVVNLATIISSKLGETAKNLEALFKEVQYEASVLLLDEFDSLGQIRDYDNNDNSEMKRVVNAIIQLMDYFPQKSILVAATNQIQMIDSALRRRFDLEFEFNLPNQQLLDAYYNFLLAQYPAEFTAMQRVYNISFAQAQQHVFQAVKNNIIQSKLNA
ncbi:ATP-binding protein [Flavobacterium agricola]|uniref:ATP-binding protein n=1 Tax=Flavobacterium agricola TaxID=2870839 RepID=A0ABY6LZF4_9FLAO|nr:ATP-binding protein [Flavobacterium agricola]UYW00789.1 ATP-binding protein [Flavobacterium agricola]